MNPTITDALGAVLLAAVPVVSAVAITALNKLRAKWGFQASTQDRANMEAEIETALKVGITQYLPIAASKGWDSPEFRTAVLNGAQAYFRERFPDRTAKIITQATQIGGPDGGLTTTLAARLPEVAALTAASPATPPVVTTTTGATP